MKALKKNWVIGLVSVLLLTLQMARADCFSGSKFPKLLASKEDDGDSQFHAITASEELNAIFMGGFTKSQSLYTYNYYGDPLAVIARIDLDTNLYVFQNVYEGSNLETITGLAVNPSGTQLGVHAIEYDDG